MRQRSHQFEKHLECLVQCPVAVQDKYTEIAVAALQREEEHIHGHADAFQLLLVQVVFRNVVQRQDAVTW